MPAIRYSNCVEYATGRTGLLAKIETEWTRLGNRTKASLVTAVESVLGAGNYSPNNIAGADIICAAGTANAQKISYGTKVVGQGMVMHFVRKTGSDWYGCPGIKSVDTRYAATVNSKAIKQKKSTKGTDDYAVAGELYVTQPADGFPAGTTGIPG